MEKMTFKEAYELPIGKEVEKKGRFSYLSWPYAVRHLRENFPEATWVIHENHIGNPVFEVNGTHIVKVSVFMEGLEFPQWLPLMDFPKGKQPCAKIDIDTMDVNTAIQRCLVKAIGLATGIGLGLYAGEDLPTEEDTPKNTGPVYTESKLPDFTEEADKCQTPSAVDIWMVNNAERIKKTLNDIDRGKLRSHCQQIKDIMKEAE